MLPNAGDIVWVEFDPIKGTEQGGRRPALVVSDKIYHEASRRAVVCPITSTMREWPFNVVLPEGLNTIGVILVDQLRAVDRTERMFDWIETVPADLLQEVKGKIAALLSLTPVIRGIAPEYR